MNQMVDDDNVDFRGGTLEISSDINSVNLSRASSNLESYEEAMSTQPVQHGRNIAQDKPNKDSAILSGVDTMSISSSASDDRKSDNITNENIEREHGAVLPQYDLPFAGQNIKDYFTYRSGAVENAIQECIAGLIFPDSDGDVIGSWLLTEISLWDHERERLLILTNKALFSIKYDFIAMKQLEFRKILLPELDTVVIGELVYPPASLVPRLNGLASGVTSVVRECLVERWNKSHSTTPNENTQYKLFDTKYFEPRVRNMRGVRLMWNKGEPLPFTKVWNPFAQDIPFVTFASHPVYFLKEAEHRLERSTFDLESFVSALVGAMDALSDSGCCIQHASIVIQSYVGVTSLLHNKNGLGFFKVRGKFSF